MKTRHALLIPLLAAFPAAALDHTDPMALNAAAIERLREGDLSSAGILLARAARLAPNDTRIARTRQALEAKRAGEPVTLDAPPPAAPKAEPAKPGGPVPPAPPPLWAGK
jgi:hypothetical protein